MQNRLTYSIPAVVLFVIAFVYWPVVHASFVLDDVIDFVDMKWLSHGDDWKHYIFRDFNYWTNYFRPLVLALYTLQVHLFNNAPGPMHAVSLGMHLINTLMVGLLAWRCSASLQNHVKRTVLFATSMLFYGLHPVLVEPVTWIGCQFDLAATMFMLLGLLANTHIQSRHSRALTIGFLFFLAACSKESAISLPLMLAVFDWKLLSDPRQNGWSKAVTSFAQRNGLTYVAIVLFGIVYLAFRRWGLGQFVHPVEGETLSGLGHFQEVCYLYLRYWAMLFWPTYGMNPIHEYDTQQFLQISPASLLIDVTAIATVTGGFYLAIKRSSPIACIIAMVTCGLLPVLHIVSTSFEPSLYHERYVMTSLAGLCAMIPLVRLPFLAHSYAKLARTATGIAGCLWLIFAMIGVHATVPLWSNSVNLWRWILAENPKSIDAKNNLLIAYIDDKDNVGAHKLIEKLLSEHTPCANCMLNAAILAVNENTPTLAAQALNEAKKLPQVATDPAMFQRYLIITGQTLILQDKLEDAESVLRTASDQNPLDPKAKLELARVLALQGKAAQAQQVGESAIQLLPPENREQIRRALGWIKARTAPPQNR
jgi:hypothetical protein